MSPARTASKKTEAGKATDDKPTLMLLDGNSLAYRAFYALPAENFKTRDGLDHERGVRVHRDVDQLVAR